MKQKAPGIPIRLKDDPLGPPIGRLYIANRQMQLDFPGGVIEDVVLALFPCASITVEEVTTVNERELIRRARITGLWWSPEFLKTEDAK